MVYVHVMLGGGVVLGILDVSSMCWCNVRFNDSVIWEYGTMIVLVSDVDGVSLVGGSLCSN